MTSVHSESISTDRLIEHSQMMDRDEARQRLAESMAQAMMEHDNEKFPKFTRYPWSQANIAVRGAYLGRAHAALRAIAEEVTDG